jgi:hypothetical protein
MNFSVSKFIWKQKRLQMEKNLNKTEQWTISAFKLYYKATVKLHGTGTKNRHID